MPTPKPLTAPQDVEEFHSAADIVAQVLIDLDLLSDSDAGSWPVKVASEPDQPDKVVTIYDTLGRVFPRSMADNRRLEYPGIQVRVRGPNPLVTHNKARQLATALDSINMVEVDLGTKTYIINTIVRSDHPIALGKVAPGKLNVFTINAMVSYRQKDTVAPLLLSAVIQADGQTMILTFDEPVTGFDEASKNGFNITAGFQGFQFKYQEGDGTDTITFFCDPEISSPVVKDTVLELDYSKTTGNVVDIEGNELDFINNSPVTNNSLYVTPPAIVWALTNPAGDQLRVVFSKAMTSLPIFDSCTIVNTTGSGPIDLTPQSGGGTNNFYYTISPIVKIGDVLTLTFTHNPFSPVTSTDGGVLPTTVDYPIDNMSTVP